MATIGFDQGMRMLRWSDCERFALLPTFAPPFRAKAKRADYVSVRFAFWERDVIVPAKEAFALTAEELACYLWLLMEGNA